MNRILAALAALAPACAPAHAQGPIAVQPEQEVRIQAPASGLRRLTIGTVMSVSADTVVVQTAVRDTVRGGRVLGQHAVPVAHLWRLEVLSGRGDPARGMAKGALVGAGAGVLGALFHKSFSRRESRFAPCDPALPPEQCPLVPEVRLDPYDHTRSAVIVGAGAVIGVVVGALKPGRTWRSVLPRPAEAAAGPARGGGVRVEGTIRF
ncbi:MAG TPA: hypothetical protein VF006_19220 [Longimicrobium sp.]